MPMPTTFAELEAPKPPSLSSFSDVPFSTFGHNPYPIRIAIEPNEKGESYGLHIYQVSEMSYLRH